MLEIYFPCSIIPDLDDKLKADIPGMHNVIYSRNVE